MIYKKDFFLQDFPDMKRGESPEEYMFELVKYFHSDIRLNGEPYYYHCFEVAKNASQSIVRDRDLSFVVALGHDLIEEGVSEDILRKKFSKAKYKDEYISLIKKLTNEKKIKYKNYIYNFNKGDSKNRYSSERIIPMIVKVSDLFSNTNSGESIDEDLRRDYYRYFMLSNPSEKEIKSFAEQELRREVRIEEFTEDFFVEKTKERLETMLFRNAQDNLNYIVRFFETHLLEEPGLIKGIFNRDYAIENTKYFYDYEGIEILLGGLVLNSKKILDRAIVGIYRDAIFSSGDLRSNPFKTKYTPLIKRLGEILH